MTIVSSIFETITIFLIIPFIKYYFLNQNLNLENYIKIKSDYAKFINNNFLILFISFIFSSFLFRIFTLKLSNKYVYKVASYFSSLAFANILERPFLEIKTANRTEILSLFTSKLNSVISFVFVPFLNIVSSFFLTTLFLSSLFLINYKIAFITIFLIGGLYTFLIFFFKKIIYNNGKEINSLYEPINQVIIESLNNIRDLILYNAKKSAKNNYDKLNNRLLNLQGESQFYHVLPRYFVEFFSLILIIIIALILKKGNDSSIFLPLIGAIAINIQKLVPSAQLLYQSWSSLNGTIVSLKDFSVYLKQQKTIDKPIINELIPKFNSLEICNLTYSYDDNGACIFENFSFNFKSGEIIGVKGLSGSGKSTLIDILMGFLQPNSGEIKINGKNLSNENVLSWQSNISLVPQNIFLLNSSILDNILFGSNNELDNERINEVLVFSQVNQFINSLPNGINFVVGENGAFLSGGQKQRIAIARALYKNSNILIFDEPTSALDEKTTDEFINSIKSLPIGKTIILVSHDNDVIKICDKIIDLT
jgi:ABC-type multidrug transport system fused ATPase/permease subunit